jgi:hypothetical protein
MKYAEYDLSGNIIAFYDDTIHSSIPGSTIQITDNQWQDCLANPGKNIVSGGLLTLAPSSALLQIAKRKKLGQLNQAYSTALTTDFSSNALGAAHTYAADTLSQTLLNNLITAGNTANYPYIDGSVYTSASHTLAELQQVLDDLITAQQAAISNYSTKVAAVNAAATVNDVNAITW